jgi:peroxiredoxin
MIKVGDKLPAGKLQEFIEVEGNGCSLGPNTFEVEASTAGKKIAIFGLPGAYTPTCSAKHVPGYVEKYDELKKAGIDEIWCVSVNDAFVMGAWGRDQHTGGKVRMMADGSADFTKATGLTLDLTRSPRHGPAQQSLFDAGGRRRREDAEHRRPGQVRGQRRGHDARAGPADPALKRPCERPPGRSQPQKTFDSGSGFAR